MDWNKIVSVTILGVEDMEWLFKFPVREMAEKGWVKSCRDKVAQLQEMLNFFTIEYRTRNDECRRIGIRIKFTFGNNQNKF